MHTPLPWYNDGVEVLRSNGHGHRPTLVATCLVGLSLEEMLENAQFIAKACNAYHPPVQDKKGEK